ncbi:hypothetical protein [Bacillus sp. MUM 116]
MHGFLHVLSYDLMTEEDYVRESKKKFFLLLD